MKKARLTDKKCFLKFLKLRNLTLVYFTEKEFITDDALNAGTVETYSLLNCDFNFNKRGKLVGVNTDSIGSFRKTK